jgi:hypothetical protein
LALFSSLGAALLAPPASAQPYLFPGPPPVPPKITISEGAGPSDILAAFLGVPYRADGAVSDDGRWIAWASPEKTLKSPGFNCSGFVVAAVRHLTGLNLPLEMASFDRDGDSGPQAPLGADWDFGLDLIMNLAPPASLKPYPMVPKLSEGPSGRPVGWGADIHSEEFVEILRALDPGKIHLIAISKPDRRFKGGLSYYHVAIIYHDDQGRPFIYQATGKAGVHRVDLSTQAGVATIRRYFPAIAGGGRRAVVATMSPEWIVAQSRHIGQILAARAAEKEKAEEALAQGQAPQAPEAQAAQAPQAQPAQAPQAQAAQAPQAQPAQAPQPQAPQAPQAPHAQAPQAQPTQAPQPQAPQAQPTQAQAPQAQPSPPMAALPAPAPSDAQPAARILSPGRDMEGPAGKSPAEAQEGRASLNGQFDGLGPEEPEEDYSLDGFEEDEWEEEDLGDPMAEAPLLGPYENPWTAAARLSPSPPPKEDEAAFYFSLDGGEFSADSPFTPLGPPEEASRAPSASNQTLPSVQASAASQASPEGQPSSPGQALSQAALQSSPPLSAALQAQLPKEPQPEPMEGSAQPAAPAAGAADPPSEPSSPEKAEPNPGSPADPYALEGLGYLEIGDDDEGGIKIFAIKP